MARIRVKRKAALMKGEETPHGKRAEKEVRFEKGVDGSLGHIIQGPIGQVRRKRS